MNAHKIGWREPEPIVVKKWVGFYLNSKGEVDMGFFDSNPGYLAHTYQVEIEVPREVYECLNRKLKCVVMGKFGPESHECEGV